jgi:hypothetical protein
MFMYCLDELRSSKGSKGGTEHVYLVMCSVYL